MTVGELRKVLESYPDDRQAFFSPQGSKTVYFVDRVVTTRFGGNPCMECEDAPTFDDIEGMVDACWEEHHDSMTETEKQAIMEFSDLAYQANKERRLEAVV